ncbi:MAG: DUF2905 domain-containing protein [Candidatus Omnitrophica bacterium]|nr:DUF2905 domain-containing protein [Candidatus Omnitrophota bacterium]
MFHEISKFMILAGALLLLAGIVLYFSGKFVSIGHLPGDIVIKRQNFSFYFPLTTSLLLSLILSAVLYFISRK